MKQNLFLGIDVGTTTAKAVVFDEQGRELKVARDFPNPKFGPAGEVLQDMNYLWTVVSRCVREAVEACRGLGEVKTVGVTGQGAGVWLLDKSGKPLTDAMVWIDGRSSGLIEQWKQEGILGKSGRVAFAGSMLANSAWLCQNHPELIEQAGSCVFCKDWIKYCLTGELTTDVTDLADSSMVEISNPFYSAEHLRAFGAEAMLPLLPPIRRSDEIVGTVTKAAAEATGLKPGTPVVCGMIDIIACSTGNGVNKVGMGCSIIGTTLFNEIMVDNLDALSQPYNRHLSAVCHFIPNKWLLTLGTMAGAPNLDWFIREFYTDEAGNKTSFDRLEEIIKGVQPGCNGVLYHPYIGAGGERAPFVKPSACAQFSGIKQYHTKAHMLRAVYEGIALSMKDCYRHFPINASVIRLAGGGSNCDTWAQMFASHTNIPVEVSCGQEIGARGVAMTSAVAAGYFASLDEAVEAMVHIKKSFDPIPGEVEIYDNNYYIYHEICEGMWEPWDKHRKFWKTV